MSMIHVRRAELAVEVLGPAAARPPLVWGHGMTSSRASEDELGLIDWATVAALHRVVRYDARGHGDSTSTEHLDGYHWRELAQDQLGLADALGIDGYVAGGASMGCGTALHAAISAPERILALVLAIPPTAWETRAAQRQNYETSADLVAAGRLDVLLRGARSTAPPDPLAGTDIWYERFEHTVTTTDPVRLARIYRGAARADLPPADSLRRLDVPALILAWSGDASHPLATAERLAELLPQASLQVARHPHDLTRWTDAVTAFLDRCAG